MNEDDLMSLNLALENLNSEFYDRFDSFNVRRPEFYKRFDTIERWQVELQLLAGVNAQVVWMGVPIWVYEDGAWPSEEERKKPNFQLSLWFYNHLSDQINWAGQYAAMMTEEGNTLFDVMQERRNQDAKWGDQNHQNTRPLILADDFTQLQLENVRGVFQFNYDKGAISWADILLEEVAEVLEASEGSSNEDLYDELVQVTAVALQWAEKVREKC